MFSQIPMKGWYNRYGTQHEAGWTVPINDEKPHLKYNCPCRPRMDFFTHGGHIMFQIIHNSFDLREAFEV